MTQIYISCQVAPLVAVIDITATKAKVSSMKGKQHGELC